MSEYQALLKRGRERNRRTVISVSGPVGELLAQGGYVMGGEAEGGERGVGHVVESLAGFGEVAVFEAWVEPAGEGDELGCSG